ncbi:Phosphate transport system regulatory protein PhoU [hydrothermal vent metagenome]|uniref:Phosphate transport system regulatory protein PhoU n=1 Tax=hydrothermal vent metagenome TaxID=652676 RepID=A0A3B1AY91_9ZZZZ
MSHYEQRLEKDLNRIREQVSDVAARVQSGLKDAMHALLTGNDKLAYATILGDLPINRRVRSIDRLCHSFIAQHLPSGRHLRWISSVIRTNIELERIGDYAVTICRESVQMPQPPQGVLADKLELMCEEARRMLEQTVDAFADGNADAAKATMGMAKEVDRSLYNTFAELTAERGNCSLQDLMRLFNVFHRLGRVAAQSKNICEETVFAVTGETKVPKVYRILFLDEDNSGLSQMAEAVARKRFPNSGSYSRAGRYAASSLNPAIATFLDERGLELEDNLPKALDLLPQEIAAFHVIVSLQGPVKSAIQEVPFQTVVQEWDIPPLTGDLDAAQTLQRMEAIYREISVRVQELMQTLRGHVAS